MISASRFLYGDFVYFVGGTVAEHVVNESTFLKIAHLFG